MDVHDARTDHAGGDGAGDGGTDAVGRRVEGEEGGAGVGWEWIAGGGERRRRGGGEEEGEEEEGEEREMGGWIELIPTFDIEIYFQLLDIHRPPHENR